MNKKYTYFVFSDAHGEIMPLVSALEDAGWNPNNPNHILISLGDNFDRGVNNLEVYNFLLKHDTLTVKGNHDEMLENFLYYKDVQFDIINNGLDRTIIDFAGLFKNTTRNKVLNQMHHLAFKVNEKYPYLKRFLSEMPHGYKIDDYILTHAGFTTKYLKHEHDNSWYPNNWTETPEFIKKYDGQTGRFRFIFGHWHAFRLTANFIGIVDNFSSIFEYGNFIGIDACTNLTHRVNVYVISSDSEATILTGKENLEEIKKM